MRISRTVLLPLLALAALAGCKNSPPAASPADSPADSAVASPPASAPQSTELPPEARSSRRSHSSPGHNSVQEAQPGVFDFYLLNLSWDPEYCATHSSAAECAAHKGFVVHGLWPQNNDGTFPENCSSAPGPANPGQYLDLQPTVSLVMHEWSTHGTCSGLAPDAYFQTIRKVFHQVAIPADLQPGGSIPAMLPPASLIAQFAKVNASYPVGSFALSCGNNQLTAMEACFSKGLQPEACQNVKSCRANEVKITAP